MTVKESCNRVVAILKARRPVPSGIYYLVVRDKRITIEKARGPIPYECIIALLGSRDINEGLGLGRWEGIIDKISLFEEDGLL